jgi:hypothetical protein
MFLGVGISGNILIKMRAFGYVLMQFYKISVMV